MTDGDISSRDEAMSLAGVAPDGAHVRERPILFSAPMVRAILEGRKTQTRRVLAWQPGAADKCFMMDDGTWHVTGPNGDHMSPLDIRFAVGDRLWVREAWGTLAEYDAIPGSALIHVDGGFDPSEELRYNATCQPGALSGGDGIFGRYRPARFMPRWASRITLAVTDVRVERLQDISVQDSLAEGVQRDGEYLDMPRQAYRALWDSINTAPGKRWQDNPWVVAITFERIANANT